MAHIRDVVIERMGTAKVDYETVISGPNGGNCWIKQILTDGRAIFIGPSSDKIMPDWVNSHVPVGHYLLRIDPESDYNGWISEPSDALKNGLLDPD